MGGFPLVLFDFSGLWSWGSSHWASGYFLAALRPDLGVALGTVTGALGVVVVVVVVLGVVAFALGTFGVPRVLGVFPLPLGVDVWALGAVGREWRINVASTMSGA